MDITTVVDPEGVQGTHVCPFHVLIYYLIATIFTVNVLKPFHYLVAI